jgi:hypothetical protein
MGLSDVVERLRADLGERVRTDEETRRAHRRDRWVLSELQDLEGRGPALPRACDLPRARRTRGALRWRLGRVRRHPQRGG